MKTGPKDKCAGAVIKAGSRDLDSELEAIQAAGQGKVPEAVRLATLAANGFLGTPKNADLALIFGCNRPFSTPDILREVSWIFARLGVSHTWLEREHCCGHPMLRQVSAENRPEMKERMKGFLAGKKAAAAEKGASRLAYCCVACAHSAKSLDAEAALVHKYILDVLLDVVQGQRLRVKPLNVAYFGGCHSLHQRHFRQPVLNWAGYRAFLDGVEGLAVQDLAGAMCCKTQSERIVAAAQDVGARAIVCACSACTAGLRVAAWGKIRIMSYSEVLARALGYEPQAL